MKLPGAKPSFDANWPESTVAEWSYLSARTENSRKRVGTSSVYRRMVALIYASMTGSRRLGREIYESKVGARALTALWHAEPEVRRHYLGVDSLNRLVTGQKGRLSRLSLIQLLQVYFSVYDGLDDHEQGLRLALSALLEQQAQGIVGLSRRPGRDLVAVCVKDNWLLQHDAASVFVRKCRNSGLALNDYAKRIGVESVFYGRFGAVCRAIYYLDELRKIPVGSAHEVLDELLNSDVHKAPFQDGMRVGHKALEIIIDRTVGEPGEAWQGFVLKIAGDPRIGARARSFVEWWEPLKEQRIQKVRGWLSREDLRLFLRAVEEYGRQSGDRELQRMFPARQKFLEGLHAQGLVRNTRLMLGLRAEYYIKQILGKEMLSSYSTLKNMTDKAVIYMDCGDFHLIEGSHSFKIWVYLACPDNMLIDYAKRDFSHSELIHRIPASYARANPSLPYDGFTHHPASWRHNVVSFIAGQGINLEWDKLFSDTEWREYKQSYGIPVAKAKKTGR